jgi:hypothetical protein
VPGEQTLQKTPFLNKPGSFDIQQIQVSLWWIKASRSEAFFQSPFSSHLGWFAHILQTRLF